MDVKMSSKNTRCAIYIGKLYLIIGCIVALFGLGVGAWSTWNMYVAKQEFSEMLSAQAILVKGQQEFLQKEHETLTKMYGKLADMNKIPVGLNNNNPANVKVLTGDKKWAGQIGEDSQGHAIFIHPYFGLRAAATVLRNYQLLYGIDSIHKIIMRFVEPNFDKNGLDNRLKYVKFVSDRLGIGANEKIDISKMIPQILEAMVNYELGVQPFPRVTYVLLGVGADMNLCGWQNSFKGE